MLRWIVPPLVVAGVAVALAFVPLFQILGFESEDLERFMKNIHRPYGLIISTGPTGSGKTTTLYSALMAINSPEVNVMTVEDPIEYVIPTVR